MKLSSDFKDRLSAGVRSCYKSPANIALVKYWGKRDFQLPANASMSFTLSEAFTITRVSAKLYQGDEDQRVSFFFEGAKNEIFASKIEGFLKHLEPVLSFLPYTSLLIESGNNFPHSAGIASSASSMSALALCLAGIQSQLIDEEWQHDHFMREASSIARLGSGSACRSIYGGYTVWGQHDDFAGSSDQYAVPVDFSPASMFTDIRDTILLVDKTAKKVSSSSGHQMMNSHPFAKARLTQASTNMSKLKSCMISGDWDSFSKVVENEALTLHALMMTSTPGYILMHPNTLHVINRLVELRKQKHANVCFTLDAGPNIHLIYPNEEMETVNSIIQDLQQYCFEGNYITDSLGQGPEKMQCK